MLEKIEALLLKGNGGAIRHPAVMLRGETLITIGKYREKFQTAQDLDLFLRLAQRGRLANLSNTLLNYRLHLDSINFAKYSIQTQNIIAVLKEAYRDRSLDDTIKFPSWRFKNYQPWEHHRTWTNMALRAGNVNTARKHAFLVLSQKPVSRHSWKLVFETLKIF